MKNFLLLFVFTSFILTASSQSSPSVFEMNERLGRGINMGNTFEAPQKQLGEILGSLNILSVLLL